MSLVTNCTIYVLPDSAGKGSRFQRFQEHQNPKSIIEASLNAALEPSWMQDVYIGSHPLLDYAVTPGGNEKT